MSFFAPAVASYYSSVRDAGFYLARVVHGLAIPTVLRTNNKAHQFAPSVPDGKTAARFRRRCAGRYAFLQLDRRAKR